MEEEKTEAVEKIMAKEEMFGGGLPQRKPAEVRVSEGRKETERRKAIVEVGGRAGASRKAVEEGSGGGVRREQVVEGAGGRMAEGGGAVEDRALVAAVEIEGTEAITVMELLRAVDATCGRVLGCRQRGERRYEISMSNPKGKQRLLDGFKIKNSVVRAAEVATDERVVSFLNLPVYITDRQIFEKLGQWGVKPVSEIRRRKWAGTDIYDGTRYVKVRFTDQITSLPYSTKIETMEGVEYFRVLHDKQEKVCRMCLQPGHIVRDCPDFQCYKCQAHGHYARECTAKLCSICRRAEDACSCRDGDEEVEEEEEEEERTEMEEDGGAAETEEVPVVVESEQEEVEVEEEELSRAEKEESVRAGGEERGRRETERRRDGWGGGLRSRSRSRKLGGEGDGGAELQKGRSRSMEEESRGRAAVRTVRLRGGRFGGGGREGREGVRDGGRAEEKRRVTRNWMACSRTLRCAA